MTATPSPAEIAAKLSEAQGARTERVAKRDLSTRSLYSLSEVRGRRFHLSARA